jgi:hypothetical protein
MAMKTYKIEHKILTLIHCAVMNKEEDPASFIIEDIKFSHWNFNYRDGWQTNAWIATGEIKHENFIEAINIFRKKLSKIIPRISLISQSYIEFTREPFIIHEITKGVAVFEYNEDVKSGGLMFMEKEQKALQKLLDNKEISEEFYYYWNDTVNTSGYSGKLLLMFSAIEALSKETGINMREKIFGKELAKELYEQNIGLRHRLVHGEYFSKKEDRESNYLESIHKKIMAYFNKKIFSEELLNENVVAPQRHPFGNKRGGRYIIKRKDGNNTFDLRDLLNDFNNNGFRTPEKYEHVFDDLIIKNY